MLDKLRVGDDELFEQLAHVCELLHRSAEGLERMLAGHGDEERALAQAIQESDRSAHDLAQQVDARAFKAFVLRVDRLELHEVASALDSAVEDMDGAVAHIAALHAHDAPNGLRALAAALSGSTAALRDAVAAVGRSATDVAAAVAEIRRLRDEGDEQFYAGVGRLFDGVPNAVELLRWKDVYEKVRGALEGCARAAGALEQVSISNE